jgi:hypothetical protein
MKKISTAAMKQGRNISEPKLTIGLDPGDRSSWYCVWGEQGEVVLEQRLRMAPSDSGAWAGAPTCKIRWKHDVKCT